MIARLIRESFLKEYPKQLKDSKLLLSNVSLNRWHRKKQRFARKNPRKWNKCLKNYRRNKYNNTSKLIEQSLPSIDNCIDFIGFHYGFQMDSKDQWTHIDNKQVYNSVIKQSENLSCTPGTIEIVFAYNSSGELNSNVNANFDRGRFTPSSSKETQSGSSKNRTLTKEESPGVGAHASKLKINVPSGTIPKHLVNSKFNRKGKNQTTENSDEQTELSSKEKSVRFESSEKNSVNLKTDEDRPKVNTYSAYFAKQSDSSTIRTEDMKTPSGKSSMGNSMVDSKGVKKKDISDSRSLEKSMESYDFPIHNFSSQNTLSEIKKMLKSDDVVKGVPSPVKVEKAYSRTTDNVSSIHSEMYYDESLPENMRNPKKDNLGKLKEKSCLDPANWGCSPERKRKQPQQNQVSPSKQRKVKAGHAKVKEVVEKNNVKKPLQPVKENSEEIAKNQIKSKVPSSENRGQNFPKNDRPISLGKSMSSEMNGRGSELKSKLKEVTMENKEQSVINTKRENIDKLLQNIINTSSTTEANKLNFNVKKRKIDENIIFIVDFTNKGIVTGLDLNSKKQNINEILDSVIEAANRTANKLKDKSVDNKQVIEELLNTILETTARMEAKLKEKEQRVEKKVSDQKSKNKRDDTTTNASTIKTDIIDTIQFDSKPAKKNQYAGHINRSGDTESGPASYCKTYSFLLLGPKLILKEILEPFHSAAIIRNKMNQYHNSYRKILSSDSDPSDLSELYRAFAEENSTLLDRRIYSIELRYKVVTSCNQRVWYKGLPGYKIVLKGPSYGAISKTLSDICTISPKIMEHAVFVEAIPEVATFTWPSLGSFNSTTQARCLNRRPYSIQQQSKYVSPQRPIEVTSVGQTSIINRSVSELVRSRLHCQYYDFVAYR